MNSSQLTPLETSLQNSVNAFFGDPEVAEQKETARRAQKRAQQQQVPETVYQSLLKPLFKEWLELRFDFAVARGPYRKVSSASLWPPLMDRSVRLKSYLGELQPAVYGLPADHILVLFNLWLQGQVDSLIDALGKAAVSDGGQSGSNNNRGASSQTPLSLQLSPFTPSSAISASPNLPSF